jgi:hypothetical protein
MKHAIILALSLLLISACTKVQESIVETGHDVAGNEELILTEAELQQLGLAGDCKTEAYETSEFSVIAQYSFCNYTFTALSDTDLIIELKKFSDTGSMNGSFQYESMHLRSSEGIISENTYGDMSRFYRNSKFDYGAEFDTSNVTYYHLYIVKDEFMIHVTSGGSNGAKQPIEDIGRIVMSRFE